MKHTEGKWEMTGQSENSRYITVKSDNGRTVARVPWNSEKEVEQDICTDYNDALLIASAPEMLEELIEVAYGLSHIDTEWARERLGFVHKVITKAEKGTE